MDASWGRAMTNTLLCPAGGAADACSVADLFTNPDDVGVDGRGSLIEGNAAGGRVESNETVL